MELERHEGAIAGAAAFTCRLAHEDQHGLQLGAAARFVAAGLLGKPLGSVRDGDGLSPRQPLPVFEADFELDPDRERVAAQRIVIEDSGSSQSIATSSFSPSVAGLSEGSVARSRLSSMTASVPIVVPNRRDATEATAAARSASSPSLAIVAEVPMQIGS